MRRTGPRWEPRLAVGVARLRVRRNLMAHIRSMALRWGRVTLFMRRHSMARLILLSLITRLSQYAGMQSAIRAGRHCKDAWCLRWTQASRRGLGPDLEGSFKFQVSIFYFPFSRGVSQPPPNKSPGPSEARKIGRPFPRPCLEAFCKAACRAAPHVDEPRLPEVLATGGKASGETSHCFASSATRRGFGWCVAKPPTELSGMPLRNSTAARTFSMRVIAARERASPSNCTERAPSFESLTWIAEAYWPAQPKRNSPRR